MSTFAIIKDVPLAPLVRRQRRRKYPFDEMAVGDMIFIPGARSISPYVSAVGKKLRFKLTTRRLNMKLTKKGWKPCRPFDKGVTFGTGVWRTK